MESMSPILPVELSQGIFPELDVVPVDIVCTWLWFVNMRSRHTCFLGWQYIENKSTQVLSPSSCLRQPIFYDFLIFGELNSGCKK